MTNIRDHQTQTYTIPIGQMTSQAIRVSKAASGAILFPSLTGGPTTSLAILGAQTRTGTFGPVLASDGSAASITGTALSWSALPAVAMTHDSIKVVAVSAQVAERSLVVSIKD